MAALSILQGWLVEAEYARHKLRAGEQEMQIEHGDMRVAYTKADIGALDSYIIDLKAQIRAAGGTVDGLPRRALSVDL